MSSTVLENISSKNLHRCIRCESIMTEIQACHLQCRNCGAEQTCEDL